MNIENEQLGLLRAIRNEELELMLSWRNAPSVRANMYTQHEIGLTEHLAWWERMKSRPEHQYFMYELHCKPHGIVGLNNIDLTNNCTSWAFYASPEAPKGTGSKMELLALEEVFGKQQLNKLCCEVLAFNKPVIRLHEKFGFKIEGILREQHKFGTDYVDVYRLGLLASEWRDKRAAMLNKLISLTSA